LIQEITLFDVYRGVGLPENMKSMAVKVILQDAERTLTDDTVEEIVQKLIAAAETVGAHLR
jgi:phenylalanyl-tRNA synthetase, beta subunit